MQMQAKQLWQAVLGDMQVRLSRNAFDNWLRPTTIVGFEDDVATVAAANTFGASTLQARYAGDIERVMSDIVGRPIRVEFTVLRGEDRPQGSDTVDAVGDDARPAPDARDGASMGAATGRSLPGGIAAAGRERPARRLPDAPRRANPATVAATPKRPAAPSQQLALAPTPSHGLNPRYVYEHYVVGSSNRFAHAASLAVADRPGGQYNPFFIHGGVGLGKTHLLHAIGHRALEQQPGLSVVYISSEKFTNDLINSLRGQRMEEFRSRYRTIDILMIDDIQFIAGKPSTQEEFFHTFNALYQSGKQVVLSSDRPPKAIAELEDRLRSRFEGGLIADVQAPDYEMRTAILRTKAEELSAVLPDEVIEYVAHKDQTNIRELEGALNKILAYTQITGRPATLQLAMEAIADAAIGQRRAKMSRSDIVDTVAAHYHVTPVDLRGRARSKEIVGPRQVAMYLMREETSSSLLEIGQELGGRDHTTVMHGIDKIEQLLQTDTALRAQLMALREALFTRT
ncbi:MAG: chromosomal replication initiator protein [Thermomicrobiales bacterium]|nr:chromosomal replication initiator protein [Thermomicrobiales bacterium]